MTADEVREALEEELGGHFSETTWKRLHKNDVKYFLEHESPAEWQTVKDQAEDLFEYEKALKQELRAVDGTSPGGGKRRLGQRKSREKPEAAKGQWFPELSRESVLRAEVYSEYLAKVAADNYVAIYRKRLLGEHTATLAPDQAHRLFRSAAAQTLSSRFFRLMGIPAGDHDARFLDYEGDVDEGDLDSDYATIGVWWDEKPEGIERRVQWAVTEGKDLVWLDFRNEQGDDDYMAVHRDSVLGELQQLASRLTEKFPWRAAQASWFILTGEPPLVPPVKTRYTLHPRQVILKSSGHTAHFTYSEVTISAAPWVSEKIVAEAYYNLQRRILSGNQNRPLERRRLEVLRFVLQRENPAELTRARRRQVGAELVEAWDVKYPNWAYGEHEQPTSDFWNAYSDAERQVLHPSLTHPRMVSQTGEVGSS